MRSTAMSGVVGDLATQFVAAATGGGTDVGFGTRFELGHLGVEADPAVGEQRFGLGIGFGVQAGALGLDVTLGLADPDRFGLGSSLGRRRSRPAPSGCRRCGPRSSS